MFKAIFENNHSFRPFGSDHVLIVIICIIVSILFIYMAKNYLNKKQQHNLIFYFMIFVGLQQAIKPFIKYYLGTFDMTIDLPLHLCNILAIITPFVLYFKKRSTWAILYFWIMAGTLQSLITPTLEQGFPHFEYFRYWFVHAGLVMSMIYAIIIFDFRLSFKDAIKSMVALNILALVMYLINLGIGSNYMYMNGKPEGETIYNVLGSWPYYILSLEVLMLVLFTLLALPFMISNKLKKQKI